MTCTANTVLTIKFYSWVQNIYEEIYSTYHWNIYDDLCSMYRTYYKKLYSWVQNVYEEMYNHYKIICTSVTSLTTSTVHAILATRVCSWVENVYEEMYSMYGTHYTILFMILERLWRLVQHVPYLLQNFIHESRKSMKKRTAHTILTTQLLIHLELWVSRKMGNAGGKIGRRDPEVLGPDVGHNARTSRKVVDIGWKNRGERQSGHWLPGYTRITCAVAEQIRMGPAE